MSIPSLTLGAVNNLSSDYFIKIFGNVVEHYPSAAIGILKERPFSHVSDICEAFNAYLDRLNLNEKELILKSHPDLAGKLATSGKLTAESKEEQSSAGLNKITHEEKVLLDQLNEEFKKKFGFPFVVCARENTISSILTALKKRLENDKIEELNTGVEEVKKICKLRIQQIIINE